MLSFPQAVALSVAIEAATLLILLRSRYPAHRIVLIAAAASLATLPFVWFFFPMFGLPYAYQIALSEFFAFAAEATIYVFLFPGIGLRNAALCSLVCNTISLSLGLLL